MAKKSYKHNAKSLRRHTIKDLRKFIKTEKLPFKSVSKLTKTEIVSQLLKLQRTGFCDCIAKLEIKQPRKLSEKQLLNIEKFKERVKGKTQQIKGVVEEAQKLDKKKPYDDNEAVAKKQQELIRVVKEKDTELERVKQMEGMEQPGMELDELFNRVNELDSNIIEQNTKYFQELLGLKEIATKQQETINDFMNILDKQKEQPVEIPSGITEIISEQTGRVDSEFLEKVNKLTKPLLQEVLNESKIEYNKTMKKAELANIVALNKNKTNQLVNQKIKQKEESKKPTQQEMSELITK